MSERSLEADLRDPRSARNGAEPQKASRGRLPEPEPEFEPEPEPKKSSRGRLPEPEPEPKKASRGRLPEPEPEPPPIEFESAANLLADKDCREPAQLIKGVLHRGGRCAVGGHSKGFKTHLLLDMALSVESGEDFLGWPTVRGRVLYINLELPRWSLRKRIRAIADAKGITDLSGLDTLTMRGAGGLEAANLAAELREPLSRKDYSLLILDPVYRLLGGKDANDAGTVTTVLDWLAVMADKADASLAYAAHYSKGNQSSKEVEDRIAGSGVWIRDCDSALCLTKHRAEDRHAYTVDLILRDLPAQPSFVVEWEYPLMREAPDLNPGDLKGAGGRPSMHTVTDLVTLLPERGLPGPDWKTAALKTGMSGRTYYRLRGLAVAQQKAEQTKGGIWVSVP